VVERFALKQAFPVRLIIKAGILLVSDEYCTDDLIVAKTPITRLGVLGYALGICIRR